MPTCMSLMNSACTNLSAVNFVHPSNSLHPCICQTLSISLSLSRLQDHKVSPNLSIQLHYRTNTTLQVHLFCGICNAVRHTDEPAHCDIRKRRADFGQPRSDDSVEDRVYLVSCSSSWHTRSRHLAHAVKLFCFERLSFKMVQLHHANFTFCIRPGRKTHLGDGHNEQLWR